MTITTETTMERATWLRDEIHALNIAYNQGLPRVTDTEWDLLFAELLELEAKHPELDDKRSPTRRPRPASDLPDGKVTEHLSPMLSVDNVRSARQAVAWAKRTGATEFVLEPKVDGVGISLVYKDGKLETARLRGDGTVGREVTALVKRWKGVPEWLRVPAPGLVEVRGEVFMTAEKFSYYNQLRENHGEEPAVSARNATAGLLAAASYDSLTLCLDGQFFHVSYASNLEFELHADTLEWMQQAGLPVNPDRIVIPSVGGITGELERWSMRRANLGYDIDGMVIKVNHLGLQDRLGATQRAPRWCLAWKFPPSSATTELLGVEWTVGKFGDLHPVGILRPVRIGDVTVERVNLHSAEHTESFGLRVGDRVLVERAGDVIPNMVNVVERNPAGEVIGVPVVCPACKGPVMREEGLAHARCCNRACTGRRLQLLKHFVSKQAMNIEGLGDKTLSRLVDNGRVKDPADLYRLRSKGWRSLSPSVHGYLAHSLTVPFGRVFFALGLEKVGPSTAVALADHFRSVDRLMAATVDELREVPGVGETVAGIIVRELADPVVQDLIARLREAGLQFETEPVGEEHGVADQFETEPVGEQQADDGGEVTGTVDGSTFVLTGRLAAMRRAEAAEMIQQAGGKVSGTVSKRTDYVVAGADPGSKLDKAERLGVQVISEEELIILLAGGSLDETEDGELSAYDLELIDVAAEILTAMGLVPPKQ